jgi:hypothetical protein
MTEEVEGMVMVMVEMEMFGPEIRICKNGGKIGNKKLHGFMGQPLTSLDDG